MLLSADSGQGAATALGREDMLRVCLHQGSHGL
jgi:hypothetical protein